MGNRGFLPHYHAPQCRVKENRPVPTAESQRLSWANPAVSAHYVSVLFSHHSGQEQKSRRSISRVLSTPESAGRPFLWDGCYHPPQATNPGGEPEIPPHPCLSTMPAAPIRSCSRWGLPCRLGCPSRGALLPHRFTLTRGRERRRAVCSLWHFPWGRPRRTLSGTVFPWSPDFPPMLAHQRPSDRLAGSGVWTSKKRKARMSLPF